MAKHSAMDIANLYIDLANSIPEDSIDNLKLNKLCYYAQGWALVKLRHALFSDTVEAWDYGPVIKPVYHAYKSYGRNPIEEPTYHVDESQFTSDEISLLLSIQCTHV